MKSVLKFNAVGAFIDGRDVSSLDRSTIAAAIKIRLGMPVT